MRTLAIVALMAAALTLGGVAKADMRDAGDGVTEDRYVDGFSHPLRIAAHVAAPVGFVAEWFIFRPFHYIISRPQLSNFFNYKEGEDVDIRL